MRSIRGFCVTASVLLSACIAAAQTGEPAEYRALAEHGTCSEAYRQEQELNADMSQRPNTPLISARRKYRGDEAGLIYFCSADDRIVRRQIFMRFADAGDAEEAFTRHTSAVVGELGEPCVAIVRSPPEATAGRSSADSRPSPQTQRTVIWDIDEQYNAMLFFYPGNTSKPWQIQLLFNSLADTEISAESERVWRAHGCNPPIKKPQDPNSSQMTLILP